MDRQEEALEEGWPSEPESTTRILPYLPLEISREIASYLTVESGLRLMKTCKALSHAGEIKVYEMLDLTGSWNGEHIFEWFAPITSAS